jgi:hypothetical protein
MINWSDPKCPISKHFTVHDALYLKSWDVYHIPTEAEIQGILSLAPLMDEIWETFGEMERHCWLRPIKTNFNGEIRVKLSKSDPKYQMKKDALKRKDYNAFIGSTSPSGAHPKGRGLDFHFKYFNDRLFDNLTDAEKIEACRIMRLKIIPVLEKLGLRLENIVGTWLHLDNMPVKYNRFFKP